ncbi:hypothetical protein DIURU_003119, partial [Diutina rugosa]
PALAPKVPIARPGAAPSSAPPAVTQIITSKEWVLPPRPKPGRKPSVDTPASKRKAQNRAAQRAFRERRATRVQELEQKLLEVEKEKEMKEMSLISSLNKLKGENQSLVKSLESMKRDIAMLKSLASRNNSPAVQASSPHYPTSNAPSPFTMDSQQISPAPSADSPRTAAVVYSKSSPQTYPPPAPARASVAAAEPVDCGVCIKDECLCENIGLKEPAASSAPSQGPPPYSAVAASPVSASGSSTSTQQHQHQPQHQPLLLLEQTLRSQLQDYKPEPAVSLKKRKRDPQEAMEIDFTAHFAKRPMPDLSKLEKKQPPQKKQLAVPFNKDSPVDSCGFCSDDTPCVCREAAEEAAKLGLDANSLPPLNNSGPPANGDAHKASLPVLHPGPSLEISNFSNLTPGAVPLVVNPTTRDPVSIQAPAEKEKKEGCTGNPGTCSQCQMDPLSTLFCSTVASKAKDAGAKPPPPLLPSTPTNRISGGDGPSTPGPFTPGGSVAPGQQGLYIPCADAYKTLSRHKRFSQVDFSTLVGKLTTRGMQVEVQSVANVLRELDRNIYN